MQQILNDSNQAISLLNSEVSVAFSDPLPSPDNIFKKLGDTGSYWLKYLLIVISHIMPITDYYFLYYQICDNLQKIIMTR